MRPLTTALALTLALVSCSKPPPQATQTPVVAPAYTPPAPTAEPEPIDPELAELMRPLTPEEMAANERKALAREANIGAGAQTQPWPRSSVKITDAPTAQKGRVITFKLSADETAAMAAMGAASKQLGDAARKADRNDPRKAAAENKEAIRKMFRRR